MHFYWFWWVSKDIFQLKMMQDAWLFTFSRISTKASAEGRSELVRSLNPSQIPLCLQQLDYFTVFPKCELYLSGNTCSRLMRLSESLYPFFHHILGVQQLDSSFSLQWLLLFLVGHSHGISKLILSLKWDHVK